MAEENASAIPPRQKLIPIVLGGAAGITVILASIATYLVRSAGFPFGPKASSAVNENFISIAHSTDESIQLLGAIYEQNAPTTDQKARCNTSTTNNCAFAHLPPGKYAYRFTVTSPAQGNVTFSLSLTHAKANLPLHPSDLDTTKDGRGLATTFELQ